MGPESSLCCSCLAFEAGVEQVEVAFFPDNQLGQEIDVINSVKLGVIDAAKVTRSALQNAASIAALFLTTEAVVADKPEKNPPAMPGGDGGMGGMDF